MFEQYSNDCNVVSIRKQIRVKLDENSLISPKEIAKDLGLPYKRYRNYITKERSEWKYYRQNERGSKCSSFHCYKAQVRLDRGLSDALRGKLDYSVGVGFDVGLGWTLSKNRNRFLVWHGEFGRVVWYETGSVRLFVRKPGNLGRAKQLFSDAFVRSGLLNDVSVFNPILDSIYPKSCHGVCDTGQKLPYKKIDFSTLGDNVRVKEFKSGDLSHPTAFEFVFEADQVHEKYEAKLREYEARLKEREKAIDEKIGRMLDVVDKLGSVMDKLGVVKPSEPSEISEVKRLDRRTDYSW